MTTIEIEDASGRRPATPSFPLPCSASRKPSDARHAPGCARSACVLACRHQQHPYPRQRPRWRQAVAPEGHWSCPPGLHPLPLSGAAAHRVRSASRSYAFRVNNKEVKLAMRSALSAKLADGLVHHRWTASTSKPRTKDAKAFIHAMGFEGPAHHARHRQRGAITTWLSFRNLEKVNVLPVAEANTYSCSTTSSWCSPPSPEAHIEEVLA